MKFYTTNYHNRVSFGLLHVLAIFGFSVRAFRTLLSISNSSFPFIPCTHKTHLVLPPIVTISALTTFPFTDLTALATSDNSFLLSSQLNTTFTTSWPFPSQEPILNLSAPPGNTHSNLPPPYISFNSDTVFVSSFTHLIVSSSTDALFTCL